MRESSFSFSVFSLSRSFSPLSRPPRTFAKRRSEPDFASGGACACFLSFDAQEDRLAPSSLSASSPSPSSPDSFPSLKYARSRSRSPEAGDAPASRLRPRPVPALGNDAETAERGAGSAIPALVPEIADEGVPTSGASVASAGRGGGFGSSVARCAGGCSRPSPSPGWVGTGVRDRAGVAPDPEPDPEPASSAGSTGELASITASRDPPMLARRPNGERARAAGRVRGGVAPARPARRSNRARR